MKLRSICFCFLVLPLFALTAHADPTGETTIPGLGNFAVLGCTTVTNTGSTVINGNLGVHSKGSTNTSCSGTDAITGFSTIDGGPGIVNGTIDQGGGPANLALSQANSTFNFLHGLSGADLSGQDLGGQSLNPGVYVFSSSANLTGTLTLNGSGDAPFIFLIGSTLTTASSSSIVLTGGADADDIFWVVGSSATLGTTTAFAGNIIALASITLNTGASLCGSATALTGAVTMDSNTINGSNCGALDESGDTGSTTPTPEPSTFLLLATGLLGTPGLFWFRGKAKPAR